jgi:CheY-like chemotaxis protein
MSHSILIVDDDPQVRRFCGTALEVPGYRVQEASNGKEALAAVEKTSFDLIVLDLCMPDMDGFEFLKAVRVKFPELKIITMSGFMGGTLLPAAKRLGGTATLVKPFSPDALLSVVSELLAEPGPVQASD